MSDVTKEKNGTYYLFFWGGIENDGLASSKFGEQRNYWFKTSQERNKFKKEVQRFADKHNKIVVFSEKDGEHTWKRIIAVMDMIYDGQNYPYEYDFGYRYPQSNATYMFMDGNYACDCNRSIFLQGKYPDDFPEELECGDTIVMKNLRYRFDD